jgi:hypothetical protein
MKATTSMTSITAAKVVGSNVVTPKTSVLRTGPSRSEPARPRTRPPLVTEM